MPEGVITLADGRRVGLSDGGDPDGSPVFLFHGTPGARIHGGPPAAMAASCGVRLLQPDRPGLGDSSGPLLSSIAAYAEVVAATADALGIERFGVAGWSGGGPFALACGALLSDRVTGVASIAGVAPVDDPAVRAGLSSAEQGMLADVDAGRWRRVRLKLGAMGFGMRFAGPLVFAAMKRELSEVDRSDFDSMGPALSSSAAPAFVQGVEGLVAEYRIWAADWGFALSSITVPVHLWQGDEDRLVSPLHAQTIAAAIPHAELHLLAGHGHISLIRCFPEILEGIRPPREA
jgi:pimeloyl-ACP methyl ester carboxylesterase